MPPKVALTVREIAARLAAKPKERAALVERIRHWTREGLITPIGEKNPGTGRHRKYPVTVLPDVALLNTLAPVGIQVSTLRHILRFVEGARSRARHLEEKLEHIICIPLGEHESGGYIDLYRPADQRELRVPKSECGNAAIIINVSQIARDSFEAIEK